jgi:hypothetical protein
MGGSYEPSILFVHRIYSYQCFVLGSKRCDYCGSSLRPLTLK